MHLEKQRERAQTSMEFPQTVDITYENTMDAKNSEIPGSMSMGSPAEHDVSPAKLSNLS